MSEEQTVYGVMETTYSDKVTHEVVEIQAKLVGEEWIIRRKRGHSVWIETVPKDKLYMTREAAEARLKEIQG